MYPTRRAFLNLLAAATAGAATRAHAQTLPKVRFVSSSPVARPYHSYLFAGVPTGLYQKLGVQPDFAWISGSSAAMQVLASGDADFANLGILEFVAAKIKQPRLPLQMVYCEDYTSLYTLVVPEESPIKSVADLKGKLVGVLSLGSGAVPTTKAMARQAGLGANDIELVAVGAGAQAMVALKSGRVDALNFYVGAIAGMESKGMKFRSFTTQIPTGCFITRESYLKSDRANAVRAMQGIALNTVYSQLNPVGAAEAFYKIFGEPTGNRDAVLKEDAHTIVRTMDSRKRIGDQNLWGGMSPDDWKRFGAFAGPDLGFDPATTKMSDYFNADLIADINKVDIALATEAAKAAPAR